MSQSKRLLAFISLIALVLPLVNCGGSPHAATEVYYLVATNIDIPYFQSAAAGLNRAGAQLGVKVDFVGPDTYDPEAQVEEFRKALGRNPAGIMVSPADPTLMRPEIDRAVAQGIPVITIDSDSPESKRLLYIGTDNYQAGTIGAQVAARELEGEGNVVVLTMPGQANLDDRLRGYRDVFAEQPQVKITEIIDVKGDPAIAFDKTTEIVEKGIANVDAFVCLVSIACKEVAEVLDRRRVTGKVIVAMDTEELTLEWIQKGAIAATVAQKPFTMAFTALKMLDDLHHHKPASLDAAWAQDPFSPIPTFVDTGVTLIDKSNVESFLQAQESATSAGGQ